MITSSPSPLLVKARQSGRCIVDVTPESAGWKYVGFRALRLAAGDTESSQTADRELCVVVLTGSIDASVEGKTFSGLGSRDSVFDPVAPAALYLPPRTRFSGSTPTTAASTRPSRWRTTTQCWCRAATTPASRRTAMTCTT